MTRKLSPTQAQALQSVQAGKYWRAPANRTARSLMDRGLIAQDSSSAWQLTDDGRQVLASLASADSAETESSSTSLGVESDAEMLHSSPVGPSGLDTGVTTLKSEAERTPGSSLALPASTAVALDHITAGYMSWAMRAEYAFHVMVYRNCGAPDMSGITGDTDMWHGPEHWSDLPDSTDTDESETVTRYCSVCDAQIIVHRDSDRAYGVIRCEDGTGCAWYNAPNSDEDTITQSQTTAERVAEVVVTFPGATDVRPAIETIGGVTYHGAYYTPASARSGASSCQLAFYALGGRTPNHVHASETADGTRYTLSEGEFYVAGYGSASAAMAFPSSWPLGPAIIFHQDQTMTDLRVIADAAMRPADPPSPPASSTLSSGVITTREEWEAAAANLARHTRTLVLATHGPQGTGVEARQARELRDALDTVTPETIMEVLDDVLDASHAATGYRAVDFTNLPAYAEGVASAHKMLRQSNTLESYSARIPSWNSFAPPGYVAQDDEPEPGLIDGGDPDSIVHASGVVEVFDSVRYGRRVETDHIFAIMTCGACGRSWDDGITTGLTPAPSGRCPFEDEHEDDA